jgi:glyoxylase-like metal-dependent hydrolase (beta-lactamase superfamily II)
MEIVPGLHLLAGVGLGVNAYLWHPGPEAGASGCDEAVLFDCGYPWQAAALFDSLERLGCPVQQLGSVAITHDDYDHSGALAEIVAVSSAAGNSPAVIAHRLEVESLEGEFWREMPHERSLASIVVRAVTGLAYAARPKQPVTVTRPVEDGAELPGGWVAVHTPGHTPGHLAFWRPSTRVLIAGDALGSLHAGKMRANTGYYSVSDEDVVRSVRKLAALQPDTICFGHGPEIVGGAAPLLDRLARSL